MVTSFENDLALEAMTLMRGGVLAKPEDAEKAWRELKGLARELAKDRLGLICREWADRLNERGVQFESLAGGTPVAQAQATRQVLTSYRERLILCAATMDLRGLGAPLPSFEHDPRKLDPRVTEGNSGPWPLKMAFQRLGRVLLLGLPGGGKTTALVHVAGELAQSEEGIIEGASAA